uniref:Uncharacterized protein LOC104232008 n=1 Tax=Nicotiana sylvestris TaxID=4096 RepID=A0A1U7WXS2_NICSY|nr:PREDICTED: uncharacterized protein LOC104232008 [Nicotiana sylvestris]
MGEGSRPAITLPGSSIPEQTTPVPTPAEGTTIPPIDTPAPPLAPASGFDSREERSPPARWNEFADAFIDHFLPAETKAARATEFENLKQGSRRMWEYHMEFARLFKYAIHMLPTMEARASTAALNSDMNYGNMVAFAQATENHKLKNKMEIEGNSKARSTGNMGESLGGGRSAFRGG